MAFEGFDLDSFWDNTGDQETEDYLGEPLSDGELELVERELGYRLPASYVELARHQNGGTPYNTCFPTKEPTSWADDHIAIVGIYAIGGGAEGMGPPCSLIGEQGNAYWIEMAGYPAIGVYFADCPSDHDVICLDYRECGPQGEPRVVHVDQDEAALQDLRPSRDSGSDDVSEVSETFGYKITVLAENFEAFIRGLQSHDDFEDDNDDDWLD